MADSDVLKEELQSYRDEISNHRRTLENEFNHLSKRYQSLKGVYEGRAAEEFKRGWERTATRFTEYIAHTTMIINLLDARLDALGEVNRIVSF